MQSGVGWVRVLLPSYKPFQDVINVFNTFQVNKKMSYFRGIPLLLLNKFGTYIYKAVTFPTQQG